jgi:hypothetical protein
MQTSNRPTSVLVLAIFDIIFGSLGLICMVCAGIGLATGSALSGLGPPGGQNQPDMNAQRKFMADHIPGYAAYEIGILVLGLLMASVLLAAGIGLLKMQNWARWTALGYACVRFLVALFEVVFTILVVNPVSVEYLEEQQKRGLTPFSLTVGMANAISGFTFLLYIALPLANLIILFLPGVRAAFHYAARPEREHDDRFDSNAPYDDDRPDILDRRDEPDDRFRR